MHYIDKQLTKLLCNHNLENEAEFIEADNIYVRSNEIEITGKCNKCGNTITKVIPLDYSKITTTIERNDENVK